MSILAAIFGFVRAILRRRATPALENLALRRQLAVLQRSIVFGEEHLRLILLSYQTYYNEARTHLSLDRNSPVPRELEPPSKGRVVAIPHLGGLHHRYQRAA